jgi:hypothetical protein
MRFTTEERSRRMTVWAWERHDAAGFCSGAMAYDLFWRGILELDDLSYELIASGI